MLIRTNFDRFTITYLILSSLLHKFSFANRSYASFFADTKGPETSFQAAVFVQFFDEIFSFVI